MKDFSLEELAKTFFSFDDPQNARVAVSNLMDFDETERIESKEGVSVDYVFRGRLLYLTAQTTTLHQQVQFSDAKGALLITALGFIAARGGFQPGFGSLAAICDLVFFAGLAAAFAAVLFAVMPRYPEAANRALIAQGERFSWPGVLGGGAAAGTPDYGEFMKDSSPNQMVVSMARCNAALSDILRRKYRALRYAFVAGGVALAGLSLGIAVSL